MTALDFPDNPAVGDVYGSASTTWRWNGTLWESTSGASGQRGIVTRPGTLINGVMSLPANINTVVAGPITFTFKGGRTYRLVAKFRAIEPVGGPGNRIINFYINGVAIWEQYNYITGAYQGAHFEALVSYVADTTLPVQVVITSIGVAAAIHSTGNDFYIEDVTYEAGAVGPGGGASGTGVEASKPATPNPGYRYFATDTLRDWLYDGTGWIVMSEPEQTYAPIVGDINTMGPVYGGFRRSNGYCDFRISATFAAGFVIYANPRYSLPRAALTSGPNIFGATIDADYYIAGYGNIEGLAMLHIPDYVTLFYRLYTGVAGVGTPISPAGPTTWTVGSAIYIQGRYAMASRYI